MGEKETFISRSKTRLLRSIFLGVFIGIIGLLITVIPSGTELEENIGLDLLFTLRGIRQSPSDVVIVSIDKESANQFNLPDDPRKWPRTLHARLAERLSEEGAAVIAFDINFTEKRSSSEDNLFAEAIKKARNIVLCDCIEIEKVSVMRGKRSQGEIDIARIVKPISPFLESAIASAPFPLPKVPRKVSQFWTFKTIAGDKPTLPVVAFQIYALQAYDEFISLLKKINAREAELLPKNREEIISTKNIETLIRSLRNIFKREPLIAESMIENLNQISAQNYRLSDMKKYQIIASMIKMYQHETSNHYLNFYGPSRTISTVPYYQVLKQRKETMENRINPDMKNKAVFIGLSSLSPTDNQEGYYTVFSEKDGIDVSGVEIAATAFANLLEDKFIRPLDFRIHIAVVFFWGLLIGIICRRFSIAKSVTGVIVLGFLYLGFCFYQFQNGGIWYPIVVPLFIQTSIALFAGVLWNYLDMKKERQNIRKAFGYYLPNSVVDQLAKNIEDIRASHQIVYGICLATDAEQYSSLAESMEPEELGIFMNKYYETIFKPIKKYDGIIADVVGDSVFAIWVASHPDKKLKEKACFAALEIQSEILKFNQNSDRLKLPTRIAIHAGHILLGNIGAFDHYEYRPVGDIVNTATRIERLNKNLSTNILVTRETIGQLDGFLAREIGEFILFGKSKPVIVYQLIKRIEESNERQIRAIEIFAEGLQAYRTQSWDEAIEKFQECNEILGDDGPSLFYISICRKEKMQGQRDLWDGVIFMEKK